MNCDNSQIRIQEITDAEELKTVEDLAWKIFPLTYREILAPEQIPYMMKMMYDQSVLQKEYANGVHFALIYDGKVPAGYISWHPAECDGTPAVKLEKLYLDFSLHGRGIGNMALRYVIERTKSSGCSAILLNVNKDNARAQKAYTRAGFIRWRSEKNPIGNGYYMDDYVMRYNINL